MMAKNCNADDCTRFTVTQWMIGIAITIMVLMQGYIISEVKDISKRFNDVNALVIEHSVKIENLNNKTNKLEKDVSRILIKELP